MGRARYVLGIAGAACIVAACTLPPPTRGGGEGDDAGCSTTSCEDATTDSGTPIDASAEEDGASSSDASAGDDASDDGGVIDDDAGADPDSGASSDAGGGADAGPSTGITCTYSNVHNPDAPCGTCAVPPEETIVRENVAFSFSGVITPVCTSPEGTGTRTITLDYADLLAKVGHVHTNRFSLAGTPPSELWKMVPVQNTCGAVLGGSLLGSIAIKNGVLDVDFTTSRNPASPAGCPVIRGCYKLSVRCVGTVVLP